MRIVERGIDNKHLRKRVRGSYIVVRARKRQPCRVLAETNQHRPMAPPLHADHLNNTGTLDSWLYILLMLAVCLSV